jgi:hypothetical protein
MTHDARHSDAVMTDTDPNQPHPPVSYRHRRAVTALITVTIVIVGAVAAMAIFSGRTPTRPTPRSSGPVHAQIGPRAPAPTGGGAPIAAGPRSGGTTPAPAAKGVPGVSNIEASGSTLIIPKLGVDAPLSPTGAVGAPDTASLTIPDNIHTVAWWDGTVSDGRRTVQENAPKPGQPGVALIAGHIDSAAAGPGALYNLKDLTAGDTIKIIDSNHVESTWTVSAPPDTTLKTELPASLWVTTGPPKLALVTWGGPFGAATGHYLDNVIVWATPTTPR